MKKKRIGIPRIGEYYNNEVFYKYFFKKLGYIPILSPYTNKEITNNSYPNNFTCSYYKDYLGHIKYLDNKCDYVLIPRICSNTKCHKHDINYIKLIKEVKYSKPLKSNNKLSYLFLGFKLNKNILKVLYYYIKGLYKQKLFNNNKENMQKNNINRNIDKILFLGLNNILEEKYILSNIISLFKEHNLSPIFSSRVPYQYRQSNIIEDSIYYYKNHIKYIIFIYKEGCPYNKEVLDIIKKFNIKYILIELRDNNDLEELYKKLNIFIETLQI